MPHIDTVVFPIYGLDNADLVSVPILWTKVTSRLCRRFPTTRHYYFPWSIHLPPSTEQLVFIFLLLLITKSSLNIMQYSKANTDDDFESRESLLTDEGSPLHQPEKSANKCRRVLLISLYLLGTALACLAAGLAGYYWHRDLNGICTSHTSESCKFLLTFATTVTDRSSPSGK